MIGICTGCKKEEEAKETSTWRLSEDTWRQGSELSHKKPNKFTDRSGHMVEK